MRKRMITVGVAPVKRSFLSMEEAARQKAKFMDAIQGILPACVRLVDIDDLCENGIAFRDEDVARVVGKFTREGIDALFLPFCDFGEEQVAAGIAKAFSVPTLVWGARDERPNTDASRGRDTQCGMFAATKVLRRYGVTYSYIVGCEAESPDFARGFDRFLRVAMAVAAVKGLRIAMIGARPGPFMSVATNEAALMSRFGMTIVPISPSKIASAAKKLIAEKAPELASYLADLTRRIDCAAMEPEAVEKVAALTLATRAALEAADCDVAATECWSAFYDLLGVPPCISIGELSAEGIPISCETDVNGAITMALLRAVNLDADPVFLADLTIRHPEDDNAELLWHCGPFPYALRHPDATPRMVDGQGRWEMRPGALTLCRFDDAEGDYYLFAGEGRTGNGPETNGTYLWLSVDNWSAWEEKLMFGPYIHHIGCAYGEFLPVLREVARYLGVKFDTVEDRPVRAL